MNPAPDYTAFAGTLTAIYCREGYPFYGQDDLHYPHILWELESGQWAMLTAKNSNQLYGWMSYYLVDEDTLKLIETGDYEDYVADGVLLDLTGGQHIYIATTVVAPYAPSGTYRRLFELIQTRNPEALTISAHLRKRDGEVRWMHRTLTKGAPDVSRQE